jgi:hypothetical protein
MARSVNQQQFESVARRPSRNRYEYFVKWCVDAEEVWSLASDTGWVMAANNEGASVFPVWPHPVYAQACAVEGWAGCMPEAVSLFDWIEIWTPGLLADGHQVGVFPVPNDTRGVVVEPSRLAADLSHEEARYG